MRHILAPVLTALAFVMPASIASSADTGVERLSLRHQTLGWEAVGRLDLGGGFCTGALISPDLVLTAAHCLIRPNGHRVDPRTVRFRAALSDGRAIAERHGLRAVVHPDYDSHDTDGLRQLKSDIALLQLSEPIPAGEAAPFATASPVAQGGKVSVVSYARGRADALGWERACGVRAAGQGVMLMSCDVYFGSSGAPVFDMSSGHPRIVSVISRGQRQGEGSRVWGMAVEQPLTILQNALRDGTGVWPGRDVAARRIRAGEHDHDMGTGGARFVRP